MFAFLFTSYYRWTISCLKSVNYLFSLVDRWPFFVSSVKYHIQKCFSQVQLSVFQRNWFNLKFNKQIEKYKFSCSSKPPVCGYISFPKIQKYNKTKHKIYKTVTILFLKKDEIGLWPVKCPLMVLFAFRKWVFGF